MAKLAAVLVQERKLREWLEGTFFSACVPSVVPHIVGIAGKSWVHNYRGPGDWCRMTRAPDIGSKGYNNAPGGKI